MSRRGPPPRTTLFVAGFPPTMRARDLAYEFERMGPLVRCDIPALRSPNAAPYAFIEYEDPRDAEAAHHDMHGMRFGRHALSIQFAKLGDRPFDHQNAPSASWRNDGVARRRPPPRRASPPPLRDTRTAEEIEEADRAAEERARARAAARSKSPSRARDDESYDTKRERDYDEDRRASPEPENGDQEPRGWSSPLQANGKERDARDERASKSDSRDVGVNGNEPEGRKDEEDQKDRSGRSESREEDSPADKDAELTPPESLPAEEEPKAIDDA
ncbi:hypothetical protein IE53DRAFT_402523 [Violaceomyces palustris]|uniref:Uncharacterized protein n=1 Tax=Violaceomyces palustris TaxID=1673888 RepID=A0ACD0P3V9_9BASI|nr:hypothetical protein IE53DRAFT_402523 [Violaceomyces palustris]